MQTVTATHTETNVPPHFDALAEPHGQTVLNDYKIIRRNGTVVSFEPSKIAIAMTKAFIAVHGGQAAASARIREMVDQLTQGVVQALIASGADVNAKTNNGISAGKNAQTKNFKSIVDILAKAGAEIEGGKKGKGKKK